jgi:predicted MFS family arabinose efflux permease
VATTILVWRGGIRRQGRALILWSFLSCLVLLVVSRGLPYPLFFTALFVWGICGGVSMTMSRTIVQEASPPEYLARIMSVFSLGLMGGMPLGSLMMGYLIGAWGPLNAALVPVCGVALTMLIITLRSGLWRQTPGPVPAVSEASQAG